MQSVENSEQVKNPNPTAVENNEIEKPVLQAVC